MSESNAPRFIAVYDATWDASAHKTTTDGGMSFDGARLYFQNLMDKGGQVMPDTKEFFNLG